MKRLSMVLMVGMLAVSTLACGLFNFSRTDDGAYRLETNLPLQIIQTVLENTANLTSVVNMNLQLRDGYIFVSAEQVVYQGVTATDVSFHLELGASNGQLMARVTNVNVSNNSLTDVDFEAVNQLIAEGLAQAAQQNDAATFEDVSVSPDGVKVVMLIDPDFGN